MPSRLREARLGRIVWAYLLILVVALSVGAAGAAGLALRADDPGDAGPGPASPSAPTVSGSAVPAVPASAGLWAFSYWRAPPGLPADPDPLSTASVAEGLRLTSGRVVYDTPGGTPRAVLPSQMSGMPVTVPIVERRTGWVSVLLPSVNRTVGWLTDDGSVPVALRDQLVLRRGTHELTWFRDRVEHARWTVTTGAPATATPLGRTFVLGRVTPKGHAYAGLDALALGSIPDDRKALPASLRAGHTAIHGWYRTGAFGRSVSNGCIRVPRKGQRTLLKSIAMGTVVTIID